jgi:hypothetical protein
LHCLSTFGRHIPPHMPLAWLQTNWQAAPVLPHAPAPLQVCGWLPLHRCAVGVQSPQVPGPKQTPPHVVVFAH